jgi:mannosyltransferase OCH1-like enzyme
MPIPFALHQIWFQGRAELPPVYAAYVRLLRATNPGWQHTLWDDKSLALQCELLGPRYAAKYAGFRYMHQKIDYGRMVVLLLYGGASVDMDMIALKPMTALPALSDPDAEGKLVISRMGAGGVGTPLVQERLMLLAAGMDSSEVPHGPTLNNAVLLCAPGNAALRHVIDEVTALPASLSESDSAFAAIQQTTGPMRLSRIVAGMAPELRDQVHLIGSEFFEPCHGADPACAPMDSTVLFHKHDGTWLGGAYTDAVKFAYMVRRNTVMQAVVLAAALFVVLAVVCLVGWRGCRGRCPAVPKKGGA